MKSSPSTWPCAWAADMLALACAAGLCSVGADVIMLGLVPTPDVA